MASTAMHHFHAGIAGLALLASAGHAAPTPLPAAPLPAVLDPVVVPPRPPVDPARLALATELVDLMTPPGTARATFGVMMAQSMNGLREQMAMAPIRAALVATGVAEGEQRRFSPTVFRRMTAILDPAFETRQRLLAEVTTKMMAKVMEEFEPQLRAGLAEAYARRLSVADLGAVLAFMRTPSGAAFAPLPSIIGTDPAVMQRQQALRPVFEKTLPETIGALREAMRSLPPTRRFTDLNETEKAEMLRLINADSAMPAPAATPSPVH